MHFCQKTKKSVRKSVKKTRRGGAGGAGAGRGGGGGQGGAGRGGTGQGQGGAGPSRPGRNTLGTWYGETGLKIRPEMFRHDNCEQI